jgi:hypothetical protein
MAYTLIQTASGERLLVKGLAGHEGCTVIAKNVPEQPSPFHRLEGGKWVLDEAAKERARVEKMTKGELIAEVLRQVRGAK